MANYIPRPLRYPRSQIRLLHVVPNATGSALAFKVQTYRLDSTPDYLAISYMWGDGSELDDCEINGQPYQVYHNCHYALWQAIQTYPNYPLWIDSLCIDQANHGEKGVQVAMMGIIYARASKVLISVGAHADDSEYLLEAVTEERKLHSLRKGSADHDTDSRLEHIAQQATFTQSRHKMMLAIDAFTSWEHWLLARTATELERFRDATEVFSRREYWSRVWVVQEIVRGRQRIVMCGSQIWDWPSLEFLADLTTYTHWSSAATELGANLSTFLSLIIVASSRREMHLAEALDHLSEFRCKDVRDRVYGLLGIITDSIGNTLRIVPDYDESRFKLAVRLWSELGLASDFTLRSILRAFEIDHTNASLLRTARENDLERADSSHSRETIRALQHKRWSLGPYPKRIIGGGDSWTHLSTDTNAAAKMTPLILVNTCEWPFHADIADSDRLYSLAQTTLRSWETTAPAAKLITRPQWILSEGEIVGCTCGEACDDDIILQYAPGLCLVLRSSKDNSHFLWWQDRSSYDIVGEAIFFSDYELRRNVRQGYFQHQLSTEDFLYLYAKDYCPSQRFLPEARLARLWTPNILPSEQHSEMKSSALTSSASSASQMIWNAFRENDYYDIPRDGDSMVGAYGVNLEHGSGSVTMKDNIQDPRMPCILVTCILAWAHGESATITPNVQTRGATSACVGSYVLSVLIRPSSRAT